LLAAVGFQFETKYFAGVNDDEIRSTGADAESVEDRRLDRRSLPAVGRVKIEAIARRTDPQML
jgi:hypothetical protein